MLSELDTFHTQNIICPYCKYELKDSWEIQSDSGELECEECGAKFFMGREVEIYYTTTKLEKNK